MTWGRISTGWICMDYVTITSETTTTQKLTGTISTGGSDLRVRSGAGSNYTIAAYLKDGSRVEILDRKTVNGVEWGRISKGWIMMQFVKLDSTENPGTGGTTGGNTGSTTTTKTGTVKLKAGTLNVRAGAGLTYRVVSYLVNGAKVTILETKTVNGTTWGRISTGWVSMDYIKL
jgi:probable enterotoxin B